METLKVKDYSYLYGFMFICCSFPLVFILFYFALDNDLLTALITIGIYAIAFAFFVRFLMRTENKYLISADCKGVSFSKQGCYSWDKILFVDTFAEVRNRGWGARGPTTYEATFIKIVLIDHSSFSLEVTNCDYKFNEIAERLNQIGHLPNLASVKQN